jgi:predicted MPP superfamily phosphohydrolase
MRIAAVGDLHCKKNSQGVLAPLFKSISTCADVVVLCGDLTDYGTVEEAHVFVKELAPVLNLPTIAVLGNHDYETDSQEEIKRILAESGVTVHSDNAQTIWFSTIGDCEFSSLRRESAPSFSRAGFQ